ncbi:molecular chaperone [Silvimonas sp. JCM 19000]
MLAVVAVALSHASYAANYLQISPILLEMQQGQTAAGLRLRNPGDEAVNGQVRVYRWSQVDGEDQLVPATDVIASPPIIQVDPQGEQLVRLVRTGGGSVNEEQSYRLLVDELPGGRIDQQNNVRLRLRYSIPVFVLPPGTPQPDLKWTIAPKGKMLSLRSLNRGKLHARISSATLVTAQGKKVTIAEGLLGYTLAGQQRNWDIPAVASAELNGAHVTATINGMPSDLPVELASAEEH